MNFVRPHMHNAHLFIFLDTLSTCLCVTSLKALYTYMHTNNSMTQLLLHTFTHLTGSSFMLKAKLLPNKTFLGLMQTCIKGVENGKILTFKVNFLHQTLSESFYFFFIEEYQFRSTFSSLKFIC